MKLPPRDKAVESPYLSLHRQWQMRASKIQRSVVILIRYYKYIDWNFPYILLLSLKLGTNKNKNSKVSYLSTNRQDLCQQQCSLECDVQQQWCVGDLFV